LSSGVQGKEREGTAREGGPRIECWFLLTIFPCLLVLSSKFHDKKNIYRTRANTSGSSWNETIPSFWLILAKIVPSSICKDGGNYKNKPTETERTKEEEKKSRERKSKREENENSEEKETNFYPSGNFFLMSLPSH